jgi:hypothetical protein
MPFIRLVPTDSGGPAFPWPMDSGMSLRDYFAAKAMQGIVSALAQGIRPADVARLASDAYGIADMMLKARQEQGGA